VLKDYLFYLIILFIVAALFTDNFVFTVLYLLAAAYFLGRLWSGRSLKGVSLLRDFAPRAFCGEDVPVKLQIVNQSWLPIIWLRVNESVPVEVAPPNPMHQVISLGPRGQATFDYALRARKRGFYKIGPSFVSTGDVLGLAGEQRREGTCDTLIVYPRIILFSSLGLPSHSPMGTLKHSQPIYEDPTRTFGKRDYVTGDSLRRVDWKATASTGRLQVKQFEPSIALTTSILLNLDEEEYDRHTRADSVELAITVAASLANWVVLHKQSVGLFTNGTDPLAEGQRFKPLLPRKGRGHLMRLLDVLARVQSTTQSPLIEMLRQDVIQLPWGTTLLLISGQADDVLFDELFRVRQRGLNPVLILLGQVLHMQEIKARGQYFGFPVYHFRKEIDLDTWRK
jgi:uncharacterized protein (DUF58 family)